MDGNHVVIRSAVKRYGNFTAVDDVNLDIQQGEFFTLLGPSGCGKTTLLRMIAGFNSVDGGEIIFGEQLVNNIPAHKRDIGMVFQNYAIFPHLSVFENVAYGLKARKTPKAQINRRVEAALAMVRIEALRDRRPNELSGGQQQRVALARAFVIEPKVLLMDEPLSNLDAKLRIEMRSTIKKLQKRLNITTLYVTHDQEEALSISDRIAVMKDGRIMQIGTPLHIYKKPANHFVAEFIGTSNFLNCRIDGRNPEAGLITLEGLDGPFFVRLSRAYTGDGVISIRPEHLMLAQEGRGLSGRIVLSTFLGDYLEYDVILDNGQTIQLNVYTKDGQQIIPEETRVYVALDQQGICVYSHDGEAISC